jgi:hypothetical protein
VVGIELYPVKNFSVGLQGKYVGKPPGPPT